MLHSRVLRGCCYPARLIGGLVSLASFGAALRSQTATSLSSAAEVRSLTADELNRHPAVHLRGTITFHEPQTGLTFLQDDTAGVAIGAGVPSQLPSDLVAGARVELDGIATAGPFAPIVTGADGGPPRLAVLSVGVLPPAFPLDIEQLARGVHDGRWVELRGVVRALVVRRFRSGVDEVPAESSDSDPAVTTRLRIDLGTVAGRFSVIVPWAAGRPPPDSLTEAHVRVHGVLGSITNNRGQWAGILLFVPKLDDIIVERSATVDPFNLPLRETNEVMRFSPAAPEEDRVRVEGVVTLCQPGFRFFIRGRQGPLEVQTPHSQTELEPGSRVNVVGYPTLLGTRIVLQDALFRVTGRESPPAPMPVTFSEALTRYSDSELVSLTGRLTQVTTRGLGRVLLIESEDHLVEVGFAQLPAERRTAIEQLQPGSTLQLTGVAIVQSSARWDGAVRSSGISLLAQSADNVVLLRKPPWWTPAVLVRVMAVLVLVIALGVIWVYLLRRRVEQQTATIRQNFEREAIWQERSRIARDIHDDVGAALTQISLLGELGRRQGADTTAMQHQLAKVTLKAREAVRALDEIVWTVNPRNDTVAGAASYICQTVQDLVHDAGLRCRLSVPDDLPDLGLAARVRHNLFLAVKEAANNVVKHAGATEVRLVFSAAAGECSVRIEDDGHGFDPAAIGAGRNGLGNMQRRLADLGGRCTVAAAQGRGTCICFEVPTTARATSNEG